MSAVIVGFGLLVTLAQEGYQPIREERGVKVFVRGHAHAIALGAEGVFDAPPEVVRRVLLDYANHPRWLHSLGESRVLRRDARSLDVYQRLNLPIIEDRDYTIHVSWGDDEDVKWLRFSTANELGPGPAPHVVRVRLNEGGWRLYSREGNRTYAVYQFTLDLGGAVPGWLGRGRAAKDIVSLFDNIQNQTQYYR
jgi:hypothetical protein